MFVIVVVFGLSHVVFGRVSFVRSPVYLIQVHADFVPSKYE